MISVAGYRSVALPAGVLEALRAHRRKQVSGEFYFGLTDEERSRVFADVLGRWTDPDALTHSFARVAARAGTPEVRFHDLRHHAATELIRGGVDPKTVSVVLGHASVSFTLATYVHVDQERLAAAAAVMDLYG